MPPVGSTGTTRVNNSGSKPLASPKPAVSAADVAKTVQDALKYEVLHERVGAYSQGEMVESKTFESAGVDVARLLSLGAVRACEFKSE